MNKKMIYLLLALSAVSFQNKTNNTKWVVTSGCSLKVEGNTNINNFSCGINNYSTADTINVDRRNPQNVLLHGSINVDIQNFDCHHPIMTADLRKTLKIRQYPKLIIRFISIDTYPNSTTGHEITKGMVLIELAGVAKRFEVDYRVIASSNSFVNFVGTRKINFSDFNITPPRKLGGMIKTNNELSVEFNLKMKVIN